MPKFISVKDYPSLYLVVEGSSPYLTRIHARQELRKI
jgi:hypothetical protein